jgi:hypothetical protein
MRAKGRGSVSQVWEESAEVRFDPLFIYIVAEHVPSTLNNVLHKVVTREAVFVQRNCMVCSRNHCCRGKAISNIYSECVSVALVT